MGFVKNPRFMKKAPMARVRPITSCRATSRGPGAAKRPKFTDAGVELDSGKDLDGDGRRAGSVSQAITGFGAGRAGRWFDSRFAAWPKRFSDQRQG